MWRQLEIGRSVWVLKHWTGSRLDTVGPLARYTVIAKLEASQ